MTQKENLSDYDRTCQRLADHQKRLVSMQVALVDAVRAGQLSQDDYEPRRKIVVEHLDKVRKLISWKDAEQVALTQESSLGLPELERCSPDERWVCYDFLRQRATILEGLITKSAEIFDDVERASSGKSGVFSHTFALSRLRKSLAYLETAIGTLAVDNSDNEMLLQQLGQNYEKPGSVIDFRQNLAAVMKLFSEIEKRSSRVAQLKWNIRAEQEQLEQMQTWLAQEVTKLDDPIKFAPPPSIDDTTRLTWNIQSPEKTYIKKTERKIDLAKRYLENCENQMRFNLKEDSSELSEAVVVSPLVYTPTPEKKPSKSSRRSSNGSR